MREVKALTLHPFTQVMQITYYGHSCFGITTGGKHLLFDPFISGNPLAKHVDVNTIPADYILLSHAHNDHTADALDIARRTGATVVGIWEIYAWATRNGIENAHPMNIGGSKAFDFGTVTMTPAVHSSSFEDGTYGGSPAGFIVRTAEVCFYYAGDTALFGDMRLLGEQHAIDLAFLPIGDNFTMGAAEAALAAEFIRCRHIIGMHYDTFGFIKTDHAQAQDAFSKRNSTLHLMQIGQTKQFDKQQLFH